MWDMHESNACRNHTYFVSCMYENVESCMIIALLITHGTTHEASCVCEVVVGLYHTF